MRYSQVLDRLQNLTNRNISQAELCRILDIKQSAMGNRQSRDSNFSEEELVTLQNHFNVILDDKENCISITYRPDVYLSAGYGVEVYDENKETLLIDSKLLVTERGSKINTANCEIVRVSGNSMSPEYRHGDRVIIDKGDTELLDGHIFAFRYKNCCYVKEMNLLGDRIKCISLNKEYDPFYIEVGEPFTVLGRIIPRVRL